CRYNHPPIDARGAFTVDQRPISHAGLGRQCLGDRVEIALTLHRRQIRRHFQVVTIALHEAMLDQVKTAPGSKAATTIRLSLAPQVAQLSAPFENASLPHRRSSWPPHAHKA